MKGRAIIIVFVAVLVCASQVFGHTKLPSLDVKTVPNPSIRVIESSKKLTDVDIFFISPDFDEENQPAIARDLFRIHGVDSMFISPYNISIQKAYAYTWKELLPEIKHVVMCHLRGEPLCKPDTKNTNLFSLRMLIVEEPNPDMISVHLSELVTRSIEYYISPDFDEENQPAIARDLFQISGIDDIFLSPYEISIGKKEEYSWGELLPTIKWVIKKHLAIRDGLDPNSIVDHLKSRGLSSDFESRRKLWDRIGRGGEKYMGTASQNIFLRGCIIEDPASVRRQMTAISIRKMLQKIQIEPIVSVDKLNSCVGVSIKFSF
jgi:protein tyrosine phosphatase (PTP) superfamily phosphohydrolase (DUF442 family)